MSDQVYHQLVIILLFESTFAIRRPSYISIMSFLNIFFRYIQDIRCILNHGAPTTVSALKYPGLPEEGILNLKHLTFVITGLSLHPSFILSVAICDVAFSRSNNLILGVGHK